MKFEIKNVAHSAKLSQETNAFACDVIVDGKRAGTARNTGHGGNTMVLLDDLRPSERKAAEEWAAAQPPKEYEGFALPVTLESIIDDLVFEFIHNKAVLAQLKRWCKKDVCFRLAGDEPGSCRTIKGKDRAAGGVYTHAVKKYLVDKYGDKLVEVVNETLGEMPR